MSAQLDFEGIKTTISDYCTEMLSLTSKLGYLYVTEFHDVEATRAANELEGLCTGLSRKIWQKIMILKSQRAD